MSTSSVYQDVQSILPMAIQQTIPPSLAAQPYASVPIPYVETAKEIKPILNSLHTSRESLERSPAPQAVQPVSVMEMLPAVTPAPSSAISVPTSSMSVSNQKYAVLVATVGGVVTKTFLMPVPPATPSNQAPQNSYSVAIPSIHGQTQTSSTPGRRIIIQTKKCSQNMTSLLSPETIQSSKPVFSNNPAKIIVNTPTGPEPRAIPSIVHSNCSKTIVTVMPQLTTSPSSETNVAPKPTVNDLLPISPIVIAPTAPQKSPPPIVIAPTTPQKSPPPIVIAPNAPQKSLTPVLVAPIKKCQNEYAESDMPPFKLAQSLARHVIHGNGESDSEEHWDAENGITNIQTQMPCSEEELNNGGNELGIRIDSVYSEQDLDNGDDLGIRIDSVYSEQDQNTGIGELGLRIDNVYSEQEQDDGYSTLGLRIDNVFSLADEESSAFQDGVHSDDVDLDNSMEIDADSASTQPFSDQNVSFETERGQDASVQTDLTNLQYFQQKPRNCPFEDQIMQILTEGTEERKLVSEDHVTTRLAYLPMDTDATCNELLQPETRLDLTSEEILDNELERIIPEIVIPDAVTPSPSIKGGPNCLSSPEGFAGKGCSQRQGKPLDKQCVARKRCTQVSKYLQHKNHPSKPIQRCSVLTPKLIVEGGGDCNNVESVPCSCGIRLSDIKEEHTKREKLINSIKHDHNYSGDCGSDMHNTSDISTESASSGGYHWSSEDEDGGIHVRGEAILEVVTVTPETVLADSSLKNILWAPLRKKRKKKIKLVSLKQPSVYPKLDVQDELLYDKDTKTCYVKKEEKPPTDRVVVGDVEWNVEPKQPIVDPAGQNKSVGWVLSKDEGSSLDDEPFTPHSSAMQTGLPASANQNSVESTLSPEGSHHASNTNIQQDKQSQVPKTIFKLVLKRENHSGWTISGRDTNQEHVRKEHECDSLAEIKANKDSEAKKETPVKHSSSEKPQSEQTCSIAVKNDIDDQLLISLGKRKRKHSKSSIDRKQRKRLANDQRMPCSSESDTQDSILGEQLGEHQETAESEVDEKASEDTHSNTGQEGSATDCSNDGMGPMGTEKSLNEEQQCEGNQGCTAYESDEKYGSNPHFSYSPDNNGEKHSENISNTLLQNGRIGLKITLGDTTNLDVPSVRKRGRPRKRAKVTADNISKRECDKSSGNGKLDIPAVRNCGRPKKYSKDTVDKLSKGKSKTLTTNDKNNGIQKTEDQPSEPPLGLTPECQFRVLDLPPEVMGKLGITDDPESINQSLVDSLNEILPLINSDEGPVDISSETVAIPDIEDGEGDLSHVIVDPASPESPRTDNSCSAAGSARNIEDKELDDQGDTSAITQKTRTQGIVKQGQNTKGLSRIEQLKAKLKQQEEALQLVRQQREESKKVFESIDMM